MDEEGAPKNVTRKTEKRTVPKPKKREKNEESTVGIQEAQNIGIMKAIEHVQIFEKEDIPEKQSHHKRDKEKKKNKATKDADLEIEKKGARVGELTGVYGEDGSRDAMKNAERKRKNREKKKNKNDRFGTGNTEEVEGNESKKWPKGDGVSGMMTGKEASKERKNEKAIRNHEYGDNEKEREKDRKEVGTHSENCEVNVKEMVERNKRKREKKKRKDENSIGWQDTYSEAKLESKTEDDSTINRIVDNENNSKKIFGTFSEGQKDDFSEKADRKKKKKKKARKENDEGDLSLLQQAELPETVEGNIQSTKCDGNATKKRERKKKYKKKKNYKNDSSAVQQDTCTQDSVDNDSYSLSHTDEIRNNAAEYASKGKKKKTKTVGNGSDEIQDTEVEFSKKGKKKKIKLVENSSNDPTPSKSNKKVRFSGQVEVFSLPSDLTTEKGNDEEDNLIRGKRFTREEDEIVKEAVYKYIREHNLGDEGLNMVLNSSKYPKLKGCWKEIGSAIPYRPYNASYYRAQVLFRRSENRKWTQEEYDEILKYQEVYGNQWKALADELGKHRWHVKDTWRRIKLPNLKKGHWSQKEYQNLFDLVNTDLQLKVSEEKKSKHGMLRDNICWTAISDRLSTRSVATCCVKWYKQLTSPMVAEGLWADTDDYRLIDALYSLDATCMEDVDWDDLVDDRSGDVCRKRWNQMALHMGRHGNKSFAEQVEVLAQRYCPHLLEAREAWDSKPRVP